MASLASYDRWMDESNEALRRRRDAEACWLSFWLSHLTFRLVVGIGDDDNVAIMLFGCRRLAGPTRWSPQQLRVSRIPAPGLCGTVLPGWRFLVEDPSVGFRAEAEWFGWSTGVAVADERQWCLWRPSDT